MDDARTRTDDRPEDVDAPIAALAPASPEVRRYARAIGEYRDRLRGG